MVNRLFTMRIDEKTRSILENLSQKTFRSKAMVIRYLLIKAEKEAITDTQKEDNKNTIIHK